MRIANTEPALRAYAPPAAPARDVAAALAVSAPAKPPDAEPGASFLPRAEAQAAQKADILKEVEQMRKEAARLREDMEAARSQAEATGDMVRGRAEQMQKVMAIFRRIAKGDLVPAEDEQRLIQYNAALYNAAKQLAAMAENEHPRHHESEYEEDGSAAPAAPAAPAEAAPAAAPAAQGAGGTGEAAAAQDGTV